MHSKCLKAMPQSTITFRLDAHDESPSTAGRFMDVETTLPLTSCALWVTLFYYSVPLNFFLVTCLFAGNVRISFNHKWDCSDSNLSASCCYFYLEDIYNLFLVAKQEPVTQHNLSFFMNGDFYFWFDSSSYFWRRLLVIILTILISVLGSDLRRTWHWPHRHIPWRLRFTVRENKCLLQWSHR